MTDNTAMPDEGDANPDPERTTLPRPPKILEPLMTAAVSTMPPTPLVWTNTASFINVGWPNPG